jgi:hypothetical protein
MGNRTDEMTSRLLLENAGGLWHLCTILFNLPDGSLYLFPFGALRRYFYGKFRLPAGVMRQDFNFTDQFNSSVVPKVSVHATGWVQIEESTGANTVGPLYIPELATLKDALIATITVTNVAKLRTAQQLRNTDLSIKGDNLRGLTAAIYLSKTPTFRHRFGTDTRLAIARLSDLIYIGIEHTASMPKTTDDPPGFQLLVGADPMRPVGSEVEMLFIVGF